MEYTFSWASFGYGILILLAGGAFILWHRQIADTFGSGPVSYDRYRLWGLIAMIIGFITMFNLHVLVLDLLLGSFFKNRG